MWCVTTPQSTSELMDTMRNYALEHRVFLQWFVIYSIPTETITMSWWKHALCIDTIVMFLPRYGFIINSTPTSLSPSSIGNSKSFLIFGSQLYWLLHLFRNQTALVGLIFAFAFDFALGLSLVVLLVVPWLSFFLLLVIVMMLSLQASDCIALALFVVMK